MVFGLWQVLMRITLLAAHLVLVRHGLRLAPTLTLVAALASTLGIIPGARLRVEDTVEPRAGPGAGMRVADTVEPGVGSGVIIGTVDTGVLRIVPGSVVRAVHTVVTTRAAHTLVTRTAPA